MSARVDMMNWVKENNPDLYWRVKSEEHAESFGDHYDEDFARYDVESMYHILADGTKRRGEHFTPEQAKEVMDRYAKELDKKVTMWDFYVAINMWWHDLCYNYKDRDKENYEEQIIDDAVTWSFFDDDAQDGKIWRYMQAMK